jgi:hypothetical protein
MKPCIGLALLMLAGCSQSLHDKCEDFCRQLAACPNATGDISGCTDECNELERTFDDTPCDDDAKSLIDCLDEGDICGGLDDDACPQQRSKLQACGEAFCRDHAADARCTEETIAL